MTKAKVKTWLDAAAVRAIKTFFQTLAGGIGVGAAMKEVDWRYAVSVAAVAAILSICTSFAGLPEVTEPAEDTTTE